MLVLETNLIKALKWCDGVNMLRIQNERMSESYFPTVREYVQQFGLNKKDIRFDRKRNHYNASWPN